MNPEQFGRRISPLKRLLCYESQHQSRSNEKSLVQFDYEKAVSNYLGTQWLNLGFAPLLAALRQVAHFDTIFVQRARPSVKKRVVIKFGLTLS